MTSSAPLDDTVQLETMESADYYTDSDVAPIIENRSGNATENIPHVTTVPDSRMDERGAPLTGRKKAYITIATLLLINLLNYMDRFTVAGMYFLLFSRIH